MDSVAFASAQNHALLHVQKPKPDGNWEPIKNINDAHVQEIGRFAVMEHKKELLPGIVMEFLCVESGESQKVAGKTYRLVVMVKEGMDTPFYTKFYEATVLEKPWDNSWELLHFVPSRRI